MNINKHLFRLPKIRLYCRLRKARPLLQGLAFAREDLDDCQLGLEQLCKGDVEWVVGLPFYK